MTFKEWKEWYKSLPGSCRWFVIFILIRPIVDMFWDLKQISVFISPLNIMGVLTPILILVSMRSKSLPPVEKTIGDYLMQAFMILLLINCGILMFAYFDLDVFGDTIKYLNAFLLYFYCRRFIRSQRDLIGVLTTFIYSSFLPLGLILYENIFSPIGIQRLSNGRGGGFRMRGPYADVMTYAIYIVGILMSMGYFYLTKIYSNKKMKYGSQKMIAVFGICILGLFAIKHVSTWGVFLAMLALLMVFNVGNAKGILMALFVCALILPIYGNQIYVKQIKPLIDKEIRVAEGEIDEQAAFNGRMWRWEIYFKIWAAMPFYSHLFGTPFSGEDIVPIMVSAGMHNDFVRLLFLVGFVGVGLYIFFLLRFTIMFNSFKPPEKFLLLGAAAAWWMHSFSTLPTLYSSYMYLIFSVIAYSFLPKARRYFNETGKRYRYQLPGQDLLKRVKFFDTKFKKI